MRSIPTRVGTTSRPQRRGRIRAVHPHACGDYRVYRWVAGTENGPSPRVWGLRAGHAGPRGPGRSIPTRVGTTRSPPAARPYPPVHPHACGDYRWVGHSLRHLSGPFPRVWGLQLGGILASYRGRSIPTRVGTTPGPAFSHSVGEVHPHACGDYVAVHRVTVNQRGPSPRVWGLPRQLPQLGLGRRSIPTRVGTTEGKEWLTVREAVHPHACGDYFLGGCESFHLHGPSPRVWGLLDLAPLPHPAHRSIPTRVGTTPP